MERHSIFTDFVGSYDGEGDVPQPVFDKITSAIRHQLRRRGLWKLGPKTLGYSGDSWNGQALEELVFDCYCHVFLGIKFEEKDPERNPVNNWENWKLQVGAGDAIEGKIYASIRNFIYDLQKKSSPEDTAIFKNLKKAVTSLVEDGFLAVIEGNPKAFSTDWVCGESDSSDPPVDFEALSRFVRKSDDWHPALGAIRLARKRAARLAAEGIRSTVEAGITPFRFGDLKLSLAENSFLPEENLADEVAPEFSGEDGNFLGNVRTWSDTDSYESKEQNFLDLEQRIHEQIDALDRRKSVKHKLHKIVDYIATTMRDSAFTSDVTQADVAQELNLAKQTLSDYMKTIREITEKLRKKE